MKAKDIDSLPPGSVLRIPQLPAPYNTYEWIRMEDWTERHIQGCVFCPVTGWWDDWRKMCFMDDEVELVKEGPPQ